MLQVLGNRVGLAVISDRSTAPCLVRSAATAAHSEGMLGTANERNEPSAADYSWRSSMCSVHTVESAL